MRNISLKIFEISLEKLLKKIFWKNIFFGQNIAYIKNNDFERFLYAIKNGENVVICKNKRYFRVQRTRIDILSAIERDFNLCSRRNVNFIQK